jgi:hypothetical protein
MNRSRITHVLLLTTLWLATVDVDAQPPAEQPKATSAPAASTAGSKQPAPEEKRENSDVGKRVRETERFDPSEKITEDLSVSFPSDI